MAYPKNTYTRCISNRDHLTITKAVALMLNEPSSYNVCSEFCFSSFLAISLFIEKLYMLRKYALGNNIY